MLNQNSKEEAMITLPTQKERGHLLVAIGNRRAIIDTGSPASISPEPFEFLGACHSPPSDIMGVTPRKMSELAGIQIDILIGCDILSQHTLQFRWNDDAMDAGNDLEDGPLCSKMDDLMGIPVFPLTIDRRPTKALFDTGAHLAYIDPDFVEGQTPSGQRNDFYPMVGQFVAPTYRVPTALDNTSLDIEYGILPDSLQSMLGMAMSMSGSTAVIGTQLLEHFDCTISWARHKISWRRR